ncbi:MAG: hypothetical protein KC613_17625 [Myxococcales bacterium]|nr:hypothetical protein [Myxococcales bacterium]MCB9525821.1 hypothetical protein [Myxococcales bacterium]
MPSPTEWSQAEASQRLAREVLARAAADPAVSAELLNALTQCLEEHGPHRADTLRRAVSELRTAEGTLDLHVFDVHPGLLPILRTAEAGLSGRWAALKQWGHPASSPALVEAVRTAYAPAMPSTAGLRLGALGALALLFALPAHAVLGMAVGEAAAVALFIVGLTRIGWQQWRRGRARPGVNRLDTLQAGRGLWSHEVAAALQAVGQDGPALELLADDWRDLRLLGPAHGERQHAGAGAPAGRPQPPPPAPLTPPFPEAHAQLVEARARLAAEREEALDRGRVAALIQSFGHPDDPDPERRSPWAAQLDQAEALATQGRVVWGRIEAASPALQVAGLGSEGARVVYSLDPFFEHAVGALASSGELRRRSAKGLPRDLPGGAMDRWGHGLATRLPGHLTGGRSIRQSTVLVGRHQLPGGRLVGEYVPLVTFPGANVPASVLPAGLWPDALARAWETAPQEPTGRHRIAPWLTSSG